MIVLVDPNDGPGVRNKENVLALYDLMINRKKSEEAAGKFVKSRLRSAQPSDGHGGWSETFSKAAPASVMCEWRVPIPSCDWLPKCCFFVPSARGRVGGRGLSGREREGRVGPPPPPPRFRPGNRVRITHGRSLVTWRCPKPSAIQSSIHATAKWVLLPHGFQNAFAVLLPLRLLDREGKPR